MTAAVMQSFGFGETLVRAVDRGGAAWFVGRDVCAALELANPRDAISRLDDDERGVATTDTPGGPQEVAIISESGVYSLTFTSRKEAAKRFKRWVTQEVLPTLRLTGRYEMPAAETPVPVPALETPDEFDALRTKLALAKEARIVFGVKAARKAWRAMDLLPELTDELPEERGFGGIADGPIAMVHRTVVDWLNARCQHVPGHRVPTMVLYHDYLRWTKTEEIAADEVQGVTGFGRALTNLGFAVKKTNRMHRVGLKLTE